MKLSNDFVKREEDFHMANTEARSPKNNKNNEAKIEDLDEYEDVNFELGDQKKTGLRCPEKQKELRETDGDLGKNNNKRKERADTYTGEQTGTICGFNVAEQKMSKFIHADDLQNETLEAVPNMEEANNGIKEPTEIKKNGEDSEENESELARIMEELEDFPGFEEDEFDDLDFLSLGSFWKPVGHHQIPLSQQESSNRNVAAQPQMQTHGPSDELLMLDGISLADLANDKPVGHHQILLSPQESSNKNVAAQPQMQTHGSSDEPLMLDGISLADLGNDKPVGHHQIPLSPEESSNRNVAAQPQMQTHGPSEEQLMIDGISLADLANDKPVGHQIPLSPQESSNKNVSAQPQMQTHGPSDESLMLDGISLADLENDLQEGQGSTSDLENQELLDEIYNDLASVLKP